MKIMEFVGKIKGEGKNIAIVVSRFNRIVTEKLLEEAKEELLQHGVDEKNIDVFRVPGSFEIPFIIKKILDSNRKYQGIIALAAIIRGETPHFDFVAGEVTRGIGRLVLEYGIPVTFGIITANTMDEAIDRAGGKVGNRGREAARTLLETLGIVEEL
ncbi:MAG TPA: 6,7-dimethyl-8-ribityllumazine synthase [candidate division WOR-3 bacterium]|uniref:6,7-dimethyl-8-ribityllumazine synthase n=1 Tax=candidate division WOR-3 bacterium TaxID=2052148 RepID=A0A7V0Q714_UNCW3|nr:MAG: 6,7-dimethyl-8-ribityllumazine synthase [Candidatus Hydrothermae bacterium]HDL59945.1 6,7-dimethyl-8-ribityllumazine synthase [candidate division WOR-3 bacterium]